MANKTPIALRWIVKSLAANTNIIITHTNKLEKFSLTLAHKKSINRTAKGISYDIDALNTAWLINVEKEAITATTLNHVAIELSQQEYYKLKHDIKNKWNKEVS